MKLLSVGSDAKTVKGEKFGFLTGILYLAPAKLSGFEVCPMRSPACTEMCLNTAGRGNMTKVQEARARKTRWYFDDRAAFMYQLCQDIEKLDAKAKRDRLTPAIRLNGTSDIAWERVPAHPYSNIMRWFPEIQFYDYTKIPKRVIKYAQGGSFPTNYHLIFSMTENNERQARRMLENGSNVAVVFRGELPAKYRLPNSEAEWDVIDGDLSDLRFNDPSPVIVGLKAKGKARRDTTGFVKEI